MSENLVIVTAKEIQTQIYTIRQQKVLLDSDLATLYQVETRMLNQAVTLNIERLPENFMFYLTENEYKILRSEHGKHRKYTPRAAMEISMLR